MKVSGGALQSGVSVVTELPCMLLAKTNWFKSGYEDYPIIKIIIIIIIIIDVAQKSQLRPESECSNNYSNI